MQWTLEERAKVVLHLARAEMRMADVMARYGLTPGTIEIWVGELLHAARERFDSQMVARLVAQGLIHEEIRTQQSGRMEEVRPLDLLQSLSIYRRAGRVLFFHAQGVSQLWFDEGAIVDAHSGALRREAAVYRIVGHDAGDFRVEVTGVDRPCHMELSGSALLLEAARRLDEGQRLAERMPPPHVVLAAGPDVLMAPGLGEAHLQVAQAFGAGATVPEVLERSPLGELETRQLIVQLDEAQQLRPTGAVRHPEVPSVERRVQALQQAQLEVSQQVMTSTIEAALVDPALPPRSHSRWARVLAGGVIAASGAVGLLLGSTDDETSAEAPPVVAEARAEPAPLVVAGPPPSPCPEHMVYLPASELSEDPTESDQADDEGLAVYVGAMCIDRHEVTVAQYRACAQRGDCSRGHTEAGWLLHGRRAPKKKRAEASRRCNADREGADDHPMNCVTWEQANAFCHSQGKRLPTEAQWERAARGDGARLYPWGSSPPTSERVNACGPECTREVPAYAESDRYEGTSPVGRCPLGATPDGVHDLGGNVREWTAGAVDELPPGAMPVEHRVVRGGGFASVDRSELQSDHRQPVAVVQRQPDLGFRCVSAPRG